MPVVLIVEDEASIRKLTSANLIARGYDVIAVGSAEEGLLQLRQQLPALILLDIKLPGMQGWDFLDASADFGAVPVIVMTASGSDATQNASHYSNVTAVLIKPFDTMVLVRNVKQALGE
jgi:CheY-like chemotaxis protein